ncbi:hypothetical protein GGP41_002674 [Bipolaris sorokiniana]|uniref:Uncharacterized protein n=1 Tax=Cochliobolus sativus TaxID=45130 RepID=A0A8H5ZJP2_COCSA|nr:hypothetical protein GGP41_002674 [Bipolaris sorokiniana]
MPTIQHQQNPSDLLDSVPRMSLRCTQASLGWSSDVSASPHYVYPVPGSSDLSDSEVRPGEGKKKEKEEGKRKKDGTEEEQSYNHAT